jgi:transcription initiation factor IIE alpha subunit
LELLLKKQQELNIELNEIRRNIQILRNTQAFKLSEIQKEPTNQPFSEVVEKITLVSQELQTK